MPLTAEQRGNTVAGLEKGSAVAYKEKLSADFPKSSGLVKKLAVAYKTKLLAQPSPARLRPAGPMASLPAREARRKNGIWCPAAEDTEDPAGLWTIKKNSAVDYKEKLLSSAAEFLKARGL